MTIDLDTPEFTLEGGLWDGRNLYELYEEAHLPWDWHKPLFEYAKEQDITIFSTPFDNSAVDLLEDLNVPAYKIASFELTDHNLISYVAQTKKPMIMSTGLADSEEIQEAISVAREGGCSQLAILHCVSSYPAPHADYNLRTIADMSDRFQCVVGLSDHTINNVSAISSVGMGACIIEKHFTLDRLGGGPDDPFSLEPRELKELCISSKIAWEALGKVNYERKASEEANIKYRRSIYVTKKLTKGERFTTDNLKIIRPGFGIAPKHFTKVIGLTAAKDIEFGSPLSIELIEENLSLE
jgi:N-acetylneuraminate synthase